MQVIFELFFFFLDIVKDKPSIELIENRLKEVHICMLCRHNFFNPSKSSDTN